MSKMLAGLLILVASFARAETNLTIDFYKDFAVIPPSYKALVPWLCSPDPIYSACEACITVSGANPALQGPQAPGVCQNGSSTFNLLLNLPTLPYQHCAGSGESPPFEGSFCEAIATAATRFNGGGGGAVGGFWQPTPLPNPVAEIAGVSWGVTITKRWHARFRHGKWHCHGDCEKFQAIH